MDTNQNNPTPQDQNQTPAAGANPPIEQTTTTPEPTTSASVTPLTTAPEAITPPTTSTAPTPPPPAPPITPTVTPVSNTGGDKKPFNKMIIFAVVGVVILIILGLLYFFALASGDAKPEENTPAPQPTRAATPTPNEMMEEVTENDIDTIEPGSPEADLEEIEEELENL